MSVNSGGISYNNGARLKNATDLSLENYTYEMAGRFVLALFRNPTASAYIYISTSRG